MLRWRLSTVRAFGGHDNNSRSFSFRTLRLSRSWFTRAHVDAAVSVTVSAEAPDTSVVALSSAQFNPTDSRNIRRLSSRSSTKFTEDRHSAIDILRQYLSSENATSDHPLIYSPTTIRSFYYRAESKNQLGMLDPKMLSLLMSLFGSLSIDSRIPAVYRVHLASRLMEASTRRTYWPFVLKVGKYKLESGMHLQDSDRFWSMRGELATAQATPSSEPLPGDAYSAILRARTHYYVIRRHSRCPEVHTYYLETLLAIRDPRFVDFAARDLSFLLRTHRVCHTRLQGLLYRLVIQHRGFLSIQSQEAILAALWSRVCQGTDGTSHLVPENGLSGMASDGCILDATVIAHSLSTILFGFAGHRPNDKSTGSFGHLFSVFSPAYALSLRWNALILFSIFNSSESPHFTGTHLTSDHVMPQATSYWTVIFGLAIAEKISQRFTSVLATQPTLAEGVLETTHTLYQLWLPITKSSLVSRDLACAIATSFLRIASVLADATLFYDCQNLYRPEDSSEVPRTSAQKLFAAQYLAAAVRVQGPLPDVVLTTLEAFSPDSKQQVLASAVQILAPIDASLAYALYITAQGEETEADPGAAHTLAMSFAQCGALRQAIHFLNGGLSQDKRGILIAAIARSLRENPRTRHPQSVFVAVVDELAALYHSHVPPEHFRGHLEQLFVVLAQQGRGSQLFPVVLSVFRRLSSFFQPRFFVRYCRVLIRHRQFTTASKLVGVIIAVHPKIARSLCILTDRAGLQTRAFRGFKRNTPLRGPTSLGLSSRLRRCPHAWPPLERSLQELLKSRRLLVAKHVFACAAATIPSRRRTVLGNILLHGVSRQPMPRNGRRVRKVLALLENLVKNYDFQPDRVSVNILVKVMISWRLPFGSSRLRELFDQLVGGGYPAADYSPLRPPFGTQQTQFSSPSGFSKLPSFVSFEKHSRPLFKMFIKAFYLSNDVEAARKVVGILRVEESKNAAEKETRQRARTRGRIKAAQKNVTPPDATVPFT